MQQDNTGQILGIVSLVLGAITFGIQMIGGLLCGWLGWPLGIAAIICGIIAVGKGAKGLGIAGIVLSVIGILIQVLGLAGAISSLGR